MGRAARVEWGWKISMAAAAAAAARYLKPETTSEESEERIFTQSPILFSFDLSVLTDAKSFPEY